MATESEVRSSAFNLVDRLRATNQGLMELENMVQHSPEAARAIGRELIQQRQKFSDVVARFQYYYTLVVGAPAPGLSALPLVTIAAAAAAFVAILSVLYEIDRWREVAKIKANTAMLNAQAAATAENAAVAADRAATDAARRGDGAEAANQRAIAAEYRKRAAQPQEQQSFTQWFQQNWHLVAAAVGGIVLIPKLVDR